MMLWGDRGCCGEIGGVVGRWVMWVGSDLC